MAAILLVATVLVTPLAILGAVPTSATTRVHLPAAVGSDGDGMSDMTESTSPPAGTVATDDAAMPEPSVAAPSPVGEPMHDMGLVTGDVGTPDMAGASHLDPPSTAGHDDMDSPTQPPAAHDDDGGHGDQMTDMTSDDSAGHGDGPAAVTAPPEEQKRVVLAGFAAVNLLVFAGAGILRRRGHGSRSKKRSGQGPSTTPRRSGTTTKDMGDRA